MVVCAGLETLADRSLLSLIAYPTICDPYFYVKALLLPLFIIISFGMFLAERKQFLKTDLISIVGVTALACIFISVAMGAINMLPSAVHIKVIVVFIIMIVVWYLKR